MTQLETGILSNARIATAFLAVFAVFGIGFDDRPDQQLDRYEIRFNALDLNKDQQLQLDEYVQHIPPKADVLKRDFKLFDFDRNRKLSLREFKTTPLVAPLEDQGPLPDPLDAYVDHAMTAMDHSFDDWDAHPDRQIQAWTFVQLFISTFGSSTTRPNIKEADSNGDGNVSRREARQFLEIQAGVRRYDGTLLRTADGRVCNLAQFRQIDVSGNNHIDPVEFKTRTSAGQQFPALLVQGDHDKDGLISFEEWQTLPSRGQISPINDFRKLDTNLDAQVDKTELLADVPARKKQMSDCVFPGFDTDGDGFLTLDEYRMTMQANPCILWQMPVADLNGDHELSFSEFTFDTMRFPLLRWLYFHRLDTNGNGTLTTNEFNFRVKTPDEFFIINADGTAWRSLFRFETHFACGSPAISPDGKTLAFDAWSVKPRTSPTIFKLKLGTSKPIKISSGSMPSWSPDGKRLVCSQSGVRIINVDGRNPIGIADNGWGWGAQWSPDGKQIVFTQDSHINSYDVQTKKIKTIFQKHGYRKIYWNMAWSPDSRQICFKGEKADGTVEVVTLDTTNAKPTPKVHHSTNLNINADIAWHPDGDRIAFAMHCPALKKTQIYEFNPDQDEPPTLFPGQDKTRNNNDICWTPDGVQLIVISGDF